MGIVGPREFHAMTDEADDYRPGSRWTFAVDPEDRVDIGIIHEVIGVGDRIPLHEHRVDEVVLILDGSARVRVGGETHDVGAGTTVFVPARTPHGTENVGDGDLRIVAIFPSTLVDMRMFERNPMPGTEDRQPLYTDWNMRTGDVRVLDDDGNPTGEVIAASPAARMDHHPSAR